MSGANHTSQSSSQAVSPPAADVAAPSTEAIPLGRIYHDPAVPELVCRYPGEPVVTVLRTAPREVVVSHQGKEVRLAVRNGELAKPGRDYLMLRDGDDRGLWLLIEPGETLE